MKRVTAGALALALLAGAPHAPASARSFTVDDLLAQETFGRAMIDPSGRWLVFEQRDPYVSGQRFDYNTLTTWSLTRVRRVDLWAATPTAAPVAPEAGPGVLLAGFSPDGMRLAVFRLQGERWSLGVVTLATGVVAWLPVTPQEMGAGRALQWRTNRELLVIARQDDLAPLTLRRGFVLSQRLPALWAAAARGEGARSVLGSGRYAGLRRRAPDNLLLKIDAISGVRTVLAQGAFTDLEVSPDNARVALLTSGPDIQSRADEPVRGPRGLETEASRLQLLDLTTGQLTAPCPDLDLSPSLLSWSPSGRRLLVMARGADGLWTSGRLTAIDPVRRTAAVLGADVRPRLDQNPVTLWTDWMGETPLVLGRVGDAPRDDWLLVGDGPTKNLTARLAVAPTPGPRATGPRRLSILSGDRAVTVDGRGRIVAQRPAEVRPAPMVGGEGARLSHDPSRDWPVIVHDPRTGSRHLGHLNGSGIPQATAPWDGAPLLAAGADVVVTQPSSSNGVARLEIASASRRTSLATVNASLSDTDAMAVRPIRHVGDDGRPVTSWLYLPAQPGKRALLVKPYLGAAPGPSLGPVPGELGFTLNLRLLTGHGYAVLVPALPRPRTGLVEPADGVARQILRAVDAALADPETRPRIDANRLAIAGYSFGGYTTMVALTQTDRFRAAISISGLSDLTALWSGLSPFSAVEPEGGYTTNWRTGGVEATQPELGGPLWANPDRFVRNSPLYAADRIRTPLLLLHGAQDQIPIYQSEAMYSALFRQGKDVQLVTYFGALHTLTSPGDLRDAYARIFAFLDEHLAAAPAAK